MGSATNAPFYSGYTGFHVEIPSGMTVLNYNEGFNTKMTAQDLADLKQRFPKVDVLLAGMQLFFVDDVVRGVKALAPELKLAEYLSPSADSVVATPAENVASPTADAPSNKE